MNKIPNKSWWSAHNMPLKQIPISKADIKNLDEEDKNIAALATWPALVKITIISVIYYAVLIGLMLFHNLSHSSDANNALYIFIGLIILSLFLTPKPSALFDGFDKIKGYKRLGVHPLLEMLIIWISLPLQIAGALARCFLTIFNRNSQLQMLSMPRLYLPQNCEYDDFISYYSSYEKQATATSNFEMIYSQTNDVVNSEMSNLEKDIHDLENNSDMDYFEKQKILDEKRTLLDGYKQTQEIIKSGTNDPDAQEKLNKTLNSLSNYDSSEAAELRNLNQSLKDDLNKLNSDKNKK